MCEFFWTPSSMWQGSERPLKTKDGRRLYFYMDALGYLVVRSNNEDGTIHLFTKDADLLCKYMNDHEAKLAG